MNRLAKALIRFYRRFISPILGGGKCRFTPTCSEYALEAFEKYPFVIALSKTFWRILRCNPFSKGGYDPLN